ncbi:hypothetical protein AMAG_00048 [Allomyces macrogynus ATCC 38327]|uniref:Uncharacterized protein n=1 Tax=Allomyces macrogynus (strain ATCC 38327) TaxID=578462 RepID=A0A0L0RV91_ALLM3|nr:hypothetical protein AMAG_00048 [Allomyces macrogynus ATCC 38327]|eukprot:KNE54044.1 hypothetical protein AMAG_00048 [Allomyces macrogynus ATCC 38327]
MHTSSEYLDILDLAVQSVPARPPLLSESALHALEGMSTPDYFIAALAATADIMLRNKLGPDSAADSTKTEAKQETTFDMALVLLALATTAEFARRQTAETYEAADPDGNNDVYVATEYQTENGKGKSVTTIVDDFDGNVEIDAKTVLADPAIRAVISALFDASSMLSAAHCGAARQDIVRPAAGVAHAAQIYADERPITASIGCPPGVKLPTLIPGDVIAFVTNVRQWVRYWNAAGVYEKLHLHYVEYCTSEKGTTWFYAAGFVSFLRSRNVDGTSAVASYASYKKKRISAARELRKHLPGAGRVKVGEAAGKGGNNGSKHKMWFVDPNHEIVEEI